ncbi:MAG: DUF4232 domain-containing protein [Candidatus Dormibacteria bacterium]
MKWPVAALAFLALAIAGCTGSAPTVSVSTSPSAKAADSPSPSASAALVGPSDQPALPPGPAACRTTDLEVAIAGQQGAAGHIGLDFEVRNRSSATCRLFGYFGLSLLNSEGKVAIAARRSTRIFTASTGPPAPVLLLPGSAPLPARPATGPPAVVAGHAHFAADYSDVCDNTPSGSGNAWQLYPPNETVPTSVLNDGAQAVTICALEVTPTQATPPHP